MPPGVGRERIIGVTLHTFMDCYIYAFMEWMHEGSTSATNGYLSHFAINHPGFALDVIVSLANMLNIGPNDVT